VERGPREIEVAEGQTLPVTESSRALVDLTREGWWCGETHIHRPLNDVPLLMRAEDLHVGMVISWWNDNSAWKTRRPDRPTTQFDGDRFLHPLGGEDERGGGALLYFRTQKPLPLASVQANARVAIVREWLDERARHGHRLDRCGEAVLVGFPIWLARGVDSVGIANNHQNRSGVYDGEAWGRARDLAAFAGPHGNGLYSQTLYYPRAQLRSVRARRAREAPAEYCQTQSGYNRLYVHCDGPLTWEKWLDGWRAGRVFVTNGPLLRLTGEWRTSRRHTAARRQGRSKSKSKAGSIRATASRKWNSSTTGRVESLQLPARVTIKESGWFLVRAIADVPKRFASPRPAHGTSNSTENQLRRIARTRSSSSIGRASAPRKSRKPSPTPHKAPRQCVRYARRRNSGEEDRRGG
jgi:hypothetical protein